MRLKGLTFIDLILLIVAFIWGVNPVIVKIGLSYMGALPFSIVRLALSAVFSWILLYLTKTYKKPEKDDFKKIVIISIFGFFVFQLFYPLGINLTTSGNAGLLLAFLPISVAIINQIFKLESISLQILVGIILSFIGVGFLILGSGKELGLFQGYIFGSLLVLIAVFGYGYYTVFSKGLVNKYSNYQVIAYTLTICTIAFIPISYRELVVIKWSEIPNVFWLICFYSGVLSISVANTLWVWGVKKIGSTRTSVYNNFTPVFSLLASYFILGETLRSLQLLGIPIVFIGLYLARTNKALIKGKSELKNKNSL